MKSKGRAFSSNPLLVMNDSLSDIIRDGGARKPLAYAMEAEVEDFINAHKHIHDCQRGQAKIQT